MSQNKLKDTSRKVGRDLKPTSGQLLDVVVSNQSMSREKRRFRSGCVCHVRGLIYIRLSVSWEIIGCRSSFRGFRTQAIATLSCRLALRLMAHHFPALVPGFLRSFSRGGLRDFLSSSSSHSLAELHWRTHKPHKASCKRSRNLCRHSMHHTCDSRLGVGTAPCVWDSSPGHLWRNTCSYRSTCG
jgi:hypothetical protein